MTCFVITTIQGGKGIVTKPTVEYSPILRRVWNRKWVFHSEADTKEAVIKEIISFFACRVGTELVDFAAMFVIVTFDHDKSAADSLYGAGDNTERIVDELCAGECIFINRRVPCMIQDHTITASHMSYDEIITMIKDADRQKSDQSGVES